MFLVLGLIEGGREGGGEGGREGWMDWELLYKVTNHANNVKLECK